MDLINKIEAFLYRNSHVEASTYNNNNNKKMMNYGFGEPMYVGIGPCLINVCPKICGPMGSYTLDN